MCVFLCINHTIFHRNRQWTLELLSQLAEIIRTELKKCGCSGSPWSYDACRYQTIRECQTSTPGGGEFGKSDGYTL